MEGKRAAPRPTANRRLMIVGGVAVLLALVWGSPAHIGPLRLGLLALGLWLLGLSLTPRKPKLRKRILIVGALVGSAYGALLGCELLLLAFSGGRPHTTRNPLPDLHNFYFEDTAVGYRHTPGVRVTYDDGIAQAEYVINARGDRDADAPVPSAQTRLLLVGDSFTFGQALPREHTIEAQIERRSDGSVDAYNLGVSGYATIHTLARFRQSDWWRGEHVVFLFFNNDIHPSTATLDFMQMVDGHLVSRYKSPGVAYDADESAARLSFALSKPIPGLADRVKGVLRLGALSRLAATMTDRELRLTGSSNAALDEAVIARAVQHVTAMSTEAAARGAQFHLVIIPTAWEAIADQWSAGTTAFVDAADAAGLQPDTSLLEPLGAPHYLEHDGHFDRDGAAAMAELILGRVGV